MSSCHRNLRFISEVARNNIFTSVQGIGALFMRVALYKNAPLHQNTDVALCRKMCKAAALLRLLFFENTLSQDVPLLLEAVLNPLHH